MTQMFENFAEQRENPLKSATTAQSELFSNNSVHTCVFCVCLYHTVTCFLLQVLLNDKISMK